MGHKVTCSECGKEIEIATSTFNSCKRNNRPFRCIDCRNKYFGELMAKRNAARTPEQIQKQKEAAANASRARWNAMSEEDRSKNINNMTQAAKKWRENAPKSELQRISKIHSDSNSRRSKPKHVDPMEELNRILSSIPNMDPQWWKALPDAERNRIQCLFKELSNKNNDTNEIKQRSTHQGSETLNKRFERQFSESHLSSLYTLRNDYCAENNDVSHTWSYAIVDDNNAVQMLVDLEGLNETSSRNEERILSIPDNTKSCIINEKNFAKSFDYMCRTLIMNYNEYVELKFKECRSVPFPYPQYTDRELISAYSNLMKMKCTDDISLNNRVGDRLIQHFHHSIWHANIHGDISPYEAWQDDDVLRKVIQNRIIYRPYINPSRILQGFNITKKATKVSVFSAGRAKSIINKYLSEYDEVFDPFSGFSGRLLGAISLGKKYIGQDASEIHVRESNQLMDFLHKFGFKFDAEIKQADSYISTGEYECLFTCPPYGDKEEWEDVVSTLSCDQWIDACLKNYKCKRYVFVVDDTQKYQQNIDSIIVNKSHFGSNYEKIIVIDK